VLYTRIIGRAQSDKTAGVALRQHVDSLHEAFVVNKPAENIVVEHQLA